MRWFVLVALAALGVGCSTGKVYTLKMVTYYPPKMEHKLPAKVKVAVLAGRRSGVREGVAEQVARRVERWLQRDPRYSIIERELLKEIVAEKELAETGLLDRQAELTAKAKMKGVDALILVEVSNYSAKRVKITKHEKKVERSSLIVPFVYRSGKKTKVGMIPIVGRKEKIVAVHYYGVKAQISATVRMVNVATAEVIATESETGSYTSPLVKERPPEESETEALLLAVDNCIAKFLENITWTGVEEKFVLSKARNDAWRRGNSLASEGVYDMALEAFKQALTDPALQTEPSCLAALHYNIGLVYEAMGDYANAEEAYRQALGLAQAATYAKALTRLKKKRERGATVNPPEGFQR
ncbi:MAG: hypothetical protein DRP63_03245 [Planctomycetota bacterium]|nr:MAG: hypothetical protein DRP63_03245 [Planctomycetota bacterium]